ncbi:MAG TPA: Crp/Fnr family transcriptional regulator [Sphingobacteriaceae bacterium]
MRECRYACDVKSCFLCKLCLDDWLPAVELHKKSFEVKKGQQVFKENDPVTGIYFVYAGAIKVHKKWDNEKELIIRFAKQGDIIGLLGLGIDPLYPVSATAVEPSVVCYLEMGFFETTLHVNSYLTYKLMRLFANELQDSQKRMRDLAHMSVKARIAQAFISLKNQFGINGEGVINIEITRQDIASFAGASYETLFKVINELTSKGIIELTGKKIRIRDEMVLLNIINEDNL